MPSKTKVKISLAVSVIFFSVAIIFASGFFGEPFFYSQNESVKPPIAQATTIDHNMIGWAWSENIGWISFNSANCDTDGDGRSEGPVSGNGCPVAESIIANYGVNLDLSTNIFSGYAWSEHIGWIKFDPAGPYPQYPNSSAMLDGSNVTGWARAAGYSSPLAGGWDGWIKMSGKATNGADYGVSFVGGNAFEGSAWGSDVVGWISFKGTNYGARLSNTLPEARNLAISQPNLANGTSFYCKYEPSQTSFSWTFYDPDYGSSQTAFQVQIAKDNAFSTIVVDSCPTPTTGTCTSGNSATSYVPSSGMLAYNTTYYWRVIVRDDKNQWSLNPASGPSFTTPAHRYPAVDFTWSPSSPSQGEEVQFTDKSKCYTVGGSQVACPVAGFYWTFQDGDPANSTLQNPVVKFSSTGSKTITLRVADAEAFTCSATNSELTKVFKVKIKLPSWKEVSP